MKMLKEFVRFEVGTSQFRIQEEQPGSAPRYAFYSQKAMENDLRSIYEEDEKYVWTHDTLKLLETGDVIFSLISGTASLVGDPHAKYLFTQNYIRLIPNKSLDPNYLIYLLNEDDFIKKQFAATLQGSIVLKYTLRMLKELELPILLTLNRQKRIGAIYMAQKKLEGLKQRVASIETTLCLHRLKEIHNE